MSAVGIETVEQLEKTGPVKAFNLVADLFPGETSVTFLYALKGALSDLPLHQTRQRTKSVYGTRYDVANGHHEFVFDLVVCNQGLQFFPDREGALREVRRVLKSGEHMVGS